MKLIIHLHLISSLRISGSVIQLLMAYTGQSLPLCLHLFIREIYIIKNKSRSFPADSEIPQVENKMKTKKNHKLFILLTDYCIPDLRFIGGDYQYSCFIECDAVYTCRKFTVLRRNVLPQQKFLRKAGQFLLDNVASHSIT